jgi:hypothetical protein
MGAIMNQEVKIYTGGELWAVINGPQDFVEQQAVYCYKIAKALWKDQNTYIVGLDKEKIKKIHNLYSKEGKNG